MDWLSFIAAIVKAVAWPATLLSLVLVLRTAIVALLRELGTIRYKDFEISFNREELAAYSNKTREDLRAVVDLQRSIAQLAEPDRAAGGQARTNERGDDESSGN